MSKKNLSRSLLAWFVILSLMGFLTEISPVWAEKAKGEPIKIGILYPLASTFAMYTEPAIAGLEWEVNRINASGGVLGRPLELIRRDTKMSPEVGLREAKSLILSEGCTIIGGCLSSAVAMSISNYVKTLKGKAIFFVGIAADSAITEQRGHRYVFRMGFNSEAWSGCVAYDAARRWPNKKRFYTINPNYAYGKACARRFKEIYDKEVPGSNLVGESWPPLGNKDFAPYISAILAANPDILQCAVYGSDLMSFLKQAEPYRLLQKVQLVSQDIGHQENAGAYKKGDLGAPIGGLGATIYDWYNHKDENIISLTKYVHDKTGYYPSLQTRFSNLAFIKTAIEKAGSATDVEKIVNALEGLTIDSIFGGPITIRACDHQTCPPYKVGIMGWDETGKYDFPILKSDTINIISGEKLHRTCEEIMALRQAEEKK